MTMLRQVLNQFENQQGALSLRQMAQNLGLEQAVLQDMIDYWVRKGRLREVTDVNCNTCGTAEGCPFIVALPRRYELARPGDSERTAVPVCNCGTSGRCH